ncbi:MAG: UbiA family prenyltransferase [Candidatus Paceibacterota bacterium]
MEKLRLYANTVPITFNSWIASFVGIVLIRALLEQFSSFKPGEFILINMSSIIHFNVFFLTSILGLMVILMFFTKTSLKEVSVICLFGFFFIWIPPIVDLIFGGVGGHSINYLFVTGKELFLQFVTYFFSEQTNSGVTLGMKIEGILGGIFVFSYVYTITKNIIRSLVATFTFYVFVLFLGSIPSLIALFLPNQGGPAVSILQSIISSHIIQNNLDPNFTANNQGLIEFAFNKTMIGINIIIAILAAFSLFFLGARKKLIALLKNGRPERLFYFFLLSIFGVALAHGTWSTNWIDIQSYILATITLICAGMFSICQNDIQDETIDAVSNKNRPLITKDLSKNDLEIASKIFLILALLSAYASSLYILFFTCLGLSIYFIYSNPPLRLKRFVILNSSLVGLACLSAVLGGFFLMNPNKAITAFPFDLAVAIIVFHIAVSNIRDIKDFEGDRAVGIKTIPTLLGLKNSKKLIAGIICFFFLLIPWYFHLSFLFVPSIIASLLSWYFINQENYKEWKAFMVYLIYLILIICTIAF